MGVEDNLISILSYFFSSGCNLFMENNPQSVNGTTCYIHHKIIVSDWLLLNANSAIVQLYHGENKLIVNEMMMGPALY